ncbi:MAG: PepSY-associated TM helix domain-containing protein [Verrucomicrobiota bacterium]
MKRRIYQLHSWLGLIAGLALLVIGLTGSLLVFKQEIDGQLAPDLVLQADPTQPRLDHDAFLATLQGHLPNHKIVGWGKGPSPGSADAVYAVKVGETEGKMFYADPATGMPRNTDLEKHETVSDWLLKLHYTFFADHVGELIVGLFGIVFCALGITGVILYRNFWKTLFRLRWKMSARIFFSDVHKMVGISSTAFNLVLGITGAWWNLSHLIGHLAEEVPEPVVKTVERQWADTVSIEKLVADARAKLPGYKANWISLPFESGGDVMMFGGTEDQGVLRSPYGSIVVFNGATGELKSATKANEVGLWGQVLDAFRPLHFGNFGGLPVKILWSLGGLAPAILALSGTFLWWKRKFR